MSDTPWVHFTVEETERGWIVWVKITTGTKRYQGPATLYPFPSAEAAWRWVREQFPEAVDPDERAWLFGTTDELAELDAERTANEADRNADAGDAK